MSFFTVSFPLSYIMVMAGFVTGVGASILLFGSISFGIVLLLIWFGIIRIIPIVDGFTKIMNILWPGMLDTLEKNIRESFPIQGSTPQGQAIYIFHPHGLFSTGHFFHIGSRFTNWKERNIKGSAVPWLWWLPFGKELLENHHFVQTSYTSMKKVLEGGEGLSVTLGGVREIFYSEPGKMKLNIGKRKGIFKMALETGTQVVPVLVYGENELYEIYHSPWLDSIQEKLMSYGIFIPIPTASSCLNWLNLTTNPLKNPVLTVVGDPIPVAKVEGEPVSEEKIDALREIYLRELRALYERTRPDSYSPELEIV